MQVANYSILVRKGISKCRFKESIRHPVTTFPRAGGVRYTIPHVGTFTMLPSAHAVNTRERRCHRCLSWHMIKDGHYGAGGLVGFAGIGMPEPTTRSI